MKVRLFSFLKDTIKDKKAGYLALSFFVLYTLLVAIIPVIQYIYGYLDYKGSQYVEDIGNFLIWLRSVWGRFVITWLEVLSLGSFIYYLLKTIGEGIKIKKKEGDELEISKPFWKYPDIWLILYLILLYLPTLGIGGAFDPWETHYGEVSRRMAERNDWISTWWENEWFFSKPILTFWLEALSFSLLGFEIGPDKVSMHIEWALRLPMFLLSVTTIYFIYKTISSIWDRRTGIWSAIILSTMPQYFFLSRQAMTDMQFIAPLSIGLCFLMLGALKEDDEEIKDHKIHLFGYSLVVNIKHLVIALAIVIALPQFIYLALSPPWFEAGSLGKNNIRIIEPLVNIPGILQALFWGIPWGIVMFSLFKERRARRLFIIGFFVMASVATLGKGFGGIVLPLIIAFAYIVVSGEWWHFKRGELLRGTILFITTSFPWYVAMLFRHGNSFFDRLFIQDHINRLAVGVHGDTGTIGYFIQQIGYGSYPWGLLIPAGLLWWWFETKRKDEKSAEDYKKDKASIFVLIWFLICFGLFSSMITKFHHYIAPALPPLAILCGIFISKFQAVTGRENEKIWWLIPGIVLVALISRDLGWIPAIGTKGYERLLHLFVYDYKRSWPAGEKYNYGKELMIFGIIFIIISIFVLVPKFKRYLVYLYTISGVAFAVWAINIYILQLSPHWSQKELFRLYYELRKSPEEPIIAHQVGWRGEHFFSGNHTLTTDGNNPLEKYINDYRGKRLFIITPPGRIESIRATVEKVIPGGGKKVTLIHPEVCCHFNLVMIDLEGL